MRAGMLQPMPQKQRGHKKILWGSLGGSVVQRLPFAQGVILESGDRVPHRAPCTEPASPFAYVSASLSMSFINK